jgi:Tfp pilus assembly protein PilN
MNNPEVRILLASLLRHVLTGMGLVGTLSEEEAGQVAGGLAILLGLAWSWIEKRRRSSYLEEVQKQRRRALEELVELEADQDDQHDQ